MNDIIKPSGAAGGQTNNDENTNSKPADSFGPPSLEPSHDENSTPPYMPASAEPAFTPPSKGDKPERWWHLWRKFKRLDKKKKAIVIAVLVIVLAALSFGAYKIFHKSKPVAKKAATVQKAAPASTTVASNLTGVQVDPAVNQRPVTGVMIENSQDARPQSGLDQAGVVFEAVAEGGITRFLALFQDTQPDYIGPVRSVRPYYLQWLLGFDGAIAHVGGSPAALADIGTWHVKDLDQFANGSYYQRITSRFAPHNVYTSIAQLNEIETKKGYGASKYTSLQRKAEQPNKAPNAKSIDIAISSGIFNSHYDYNPANNTYNRSQGGAGHVVVNKAGVQTQITPKVVVAMVMPQGIEPDDQHTSYGTLGFGQVYIFQDGVVTQGAWHKAQNGTQFTFTDGSNKPVKLDPGQTWFTIVGSADKVTFKP